MPGILYLYIFQLNFFMAAFFSDPNVGLFAIFLPISIVALLLAGWDRYR